MAASVRRALPLLAAAALLAGCTDDATTARAPRGRVEITLHDYRLTPQIVTTRRKTLTFRVVNDGRLPHNFHIRGVGRERLEIGTLLPGESTAKTVTLPRGDFRMYCSISNHEELGEYGSLTVK
jgi:cupredoxin-like protein